jgi:hypothetical protein
MPARRAPAKRILVAVPLLAVGLVAISSPGVANASNDAVGSPGAPSASNDAVGSPGVPNMSNDAVGPPGVPNGNNGGFGQPGVANASDDDSDDTNPHPKSHRYADAVGSELTLPLVRSQAEPSHSGSTVPQGIDGSAAGMPGIGGGGRMPASKPIVMPPGQAAAQLGVQSTSPAVPASPIVPVAPQ